MEVHEGYGLSGNGTDGGDEPDGIWDWEFAEQTDV
jgi:hypothetical protein